MLKITINNTALELRPDTSINLEFRNPVFENEVLQGGFSYSFTFPLTDVNRVVLGFPDRVDGAFPFQKDFDCIIESGSVQIVGRLRIRKVKTKEVTANVFTQSGAFADLMSNTPMNQVPMGSETIELVTPFLALDLLARDIETIPMDTRMTGTLAFYDGATLINEIAYRCRWKGSVALTLQNLVDRINNRNPFIDWNAATIYNEYDIVLQPGTGQPYMVVDGYTNVQNRPLVAPTFLLGTAYTPGDQVSDGGDFFECLIANDDELTSNATFWEEVTDYYWVAIWDTDFRGDWLGADPATYPKADLYDDPNDDYRIVATYEAPYAVLRDTLLGTRGQMDEPESFTDFNTCWDGFTCDFLWVIEDLVDEGEATYMRRRSAGIEVFMKEKNQIDPVASDANMCFPMILNEEFNSKPNGIFLNFLNYYINEHHVTNNYLVDVPFGLTYNDNFHVCAHVYLIHSIKALFSFLGLTLQDFDVLNDSKNRKIIVYNNAADFANSLSPVNGRSYDSTSLLIELSRHMPDVSIAKFLNGVRAYLFLGVFFDLFQRRAAIMSLDLFINSTEFEDWTDLVVPQYDIERNETNGFSLEYQHDSTDSVIGERVQDEFNGPVGEPVADLATLQAIEFAAENEIRLVEDINLYYQNQTNEDLTFTWVFYSENFQRLEIGQGKTKYQPQCSTLVMYQGYDKAFPPFTNDVVPFVAGNEYRAGEWVFDPSDPLSFRFVIADNVNEPFTTGSFFAESETPDYLYLPHAKHLGKVGTLKGNCSLRLLNFEGYQETGDREIPLATGNGLLIQKDGTQVAFDDSLQFNGETGIYETRAKDWLRFLNNTREVTFQLRPNAVWLNNLKFYRKVKIKGVPYVLKSVKLPMPFDGKLAEVVLCTVN